MFGAVKEVNSTLQPVTLAGPNPGIVDKVDYTLSADYPLIMTQGGTGVGAIGYGSGNAITYNPFCLIGTDPDTGDEIRKGVLKVDCVCAEQVAGGDCAKYLEYNTANDNTTYNIPLWSNTNTANGYREQYVAGGYPLTYNPITGNLSSTSVNARYVNATSCVTIGDSCYTANGIRIATESSFVIGDASNQMSFNSSDGTLCAVSLEVETLKSEDIYTCKIRDMCGNLLMCLPNCDDLVNFVACTRFDKGARFYESAIYTECGIETRYDINGYTPDGDSTWCIWCDGSAVFCACVESPYMCSNCFEGPHYGSHCGSIQLPNNTWSLVGDDVYIGDRNVAGMLGIKGANGNTGIAFFLCGNDNCCATLWYNGSGLTLSGTNFYNSPAYTATWCNNHVLPDRHNVYCYLYNKCVVTAYSSGNTLYIRTQANAGL